LLINLPLCALLLAEPVRAVRPRHDSKLHLSAEQAYGIPISEARRSPTLWFLLAAQLLASISLSGIVGHSVPLLTDRGVSSTLAAGVLSSVGLATVLGRIVSGYLQDVFGSPRVALLFFVAPLLGMFMIGVGSGPGVLIAAGVVLGLGMGAEGEIMPYFVSRYFGLRAFGEIYSYIYAAFVIGAGFGPFLIGFSFDATGSYRLALRGVEVAMAVAVLFISLLGPYVYSAGRENAPRDHFIEAVPQDSV
jgi:MFS family permease